MLRRRRFVARGRVALAVVVVTAILACLVLTAENDAEQPATASTATAPPRAASTRQRNDKVDSGWAVSLPGAIARGSTGLEQQTILHHVLEQGRSPLISRKWGTGGEERGARSEELRATSEQVDGADEGGSPSRFAVRPDGIEGWRSPGPVFAPLEEPWQPPMIGRSAETRTARVDDEERHSGQPMEEIADEPETATADVEGKSFSERLGDVSSSAAAGAAVEESFDLQRKNQSADRAAERETNVSPARSLPTVEPPPPLTPELVQLRSRVRSVLKGYYKKLLNSGQHDPWEVMHGMLAYGVHSRVRQGGPRGEPITAVGWLCYNKPCKGQMLLHVNHKGELRAKYGVGLQGHLGQFLAMLAQCRVSSDYPIRVGKREYTIRDLIEAEKQTCYPKSELTFKLIALQYYLDSNERWVNDQGQEWDIPRLIREELSQPIRGAACGGTHRLSGLSLAVKTRLRRGEPLDGEYARAAKFVEKYHQYAFRLQNRDGSLSTLWFRGRGDESDINRRIKTTGHILEWLCYSLSDEELRREPTVRAVSYLANLMYSKYNHEWEVGPMCHATHALLLYDERVFQPFDDENYDVVYRPNPRPASVTYPSNSFRR